MARILISVKAATIGHSIHPKIASKIRELVSENITSPDVVRKCLEQYVDKEMFGSHEGHQKPRKSNRRYYPSRQDLRSHIARAISASKYCGDNQESLKRKIEQWRRDIILPFVTAYHPGVKNLQQILMQEWNLIKNQPLLKKIYKTPPIISYKRGKSLKDILVRARL